MGATLAGFFFQDLVSVDVEISQVKRFYMLTNCYQDDSHQYVTSITQFSAVRRFAEITEITTEITEITSNILLLGPIYGCFSIIKSCTVDIRY